MSAEDDEDAAEDASELLVGRVSEHIGGQDVDASVLTEGLLLRRELVEEWVGGGTPPVQVRYETSRPRARSR